MRSPRRADEKAISAVTEKKKKRKKSFRKKSSSEYKGEKLSAVRANRDAH